MEMIHKDLAKAMPTPRGLFCNTCGKRETLTVNRAASHLAYGWPRCCGYTMRLLTVNDNEN